MSSAMSEEHQDIHLNKKEDNPHNTKEVPVEAKKPEKMVDEKEDKESIKIA